MRHGFDRVTGPFYDTGARQDWLGVTRQAINKRVKARTLLGCRTADGMIVYPAWQFQDDGTAIAHLSEVLDALAIGSDDPWDWALWLSAPAPYLDGADGGVSAARWLAGGNDPRPVLIAARDDAQRWSR